MLQALVNINLEKVRERIAQGDCPTVPALSVETLEEMVLSLASPTPPTEAQVDHMVSRFLQWKLPETFSPDGGISFEPIRNAGTQYEERREPVGTNLLDANQANAMVLHMLEGLPAPA